VPLGTAFGYFHIPYLKARGENWKIKIGYFEVDDLIFEVIALWININQCKKAIPLAIKQPTANTEF